MINSLQRESLSCPRCAEAKVFVKELNARICKRDAPYPGVRLSPPLITPSLKIDWLTTSLPLLSNTVLIKKAGGVLNVQRNWLRICQLEITESFLQLLKTSLSNCIVNWLSFQERWEIREPPASPNGFSSEQEFSSQQECPFS